MLRIVLVYAAFAALWIFLSDFALVLLVRDTVALTRLAMIKGVLFILVTAGLLYLMIRGNTHRIARIEEARRDSEARFRSYVQNAPVAVLVFDRTGRCVDFNPAAVQLMGYTVEQMGRESLADPRRAEEGSRSGLQELAWQVTQGNTEGELSVLRPDGRPVWISLRASRLNETLSLVFCQDVTARRQAAMASEATLQLLRICNQAGGTRELLRELTGYFQRISGCEAVGVRLRQGEDFPYYETRGFPAEFVRLENSLCAVGPDGKPVRDCEGNPLMECMCGNILCGRFDPEKSFFTRYGSFWSGATTELLAGTTDKERLARTRNRCNSAGYESVALIPLRTRERAFGLFQFNDHRRGRFTAESVGFLEGLVNYTAIALSKLETERELGESGQFSRQVIESAAEGVVVYGPDLRYVTWNPFMERLTGLPASSVLGRTPDELFPFLRKAGAVQRALAGETPPPLEVPFEIPQTGRRGWTVNTYAPLRNASGQIIGVIGTVRDITEGRQAEEDLRETTRRLELAMASDNLGTWVWDIEADRLNIDDRVLELFGQRRETFGGRLADWERELHPEDREVTLAGLRAALRQDRDFQLEYRIVRPDAQVRAIRTNALVIRNAGGQAQRAIGLIKDVTAEKDLEDRLRQAQKMESVGRLAGGVAHDFNNMLQVIGSYVELVLQRTDPSQPAHQYLLQVQKAAQRSSDLTGQLLAFARKQAVSPRVLDLNESVAGMLRMLQRLIGEDVELAWIPGSDAGRVRLDPSQLDQVLANLAVNARDAITGPGKLSIRTSAATVDQEAAHRNPDAVAGDYVLLSVSDDGCGMDRETISHLFEPFFTTKEVGKGTGLGLATVYGIVHQNNGFITVESSPGQGSTFRIFLPRLTGPPTEGSATEQLPLRGSETVLLVEDEASILELGKMLLEELGYQVLAAGGATEALELAERHPQPIHLLLTDVVMPRMNGPELASRLASLRPRMRCLYMSGYAEGLAARGLSREMNYLRKPFTLTDLSRKVREALDRRD